MVRWEKKGQDLFGKVNKFRFCKDVAIFQVVSVTASDALLNGTGICPEIYPWREAKVQE
jgi:hypothetical protein